MPSEWNRSEIEETGEFDLESLFLLLSHAIERIGAKRVVLDTIESLFSGVPQPGDRARASSRPLFRWLKEHAVTAIITGERASTGSPARGSRSTSPTA